MGLIILIIGLVLGVGSLAFFIYKNKKIISAHQVGVAKYKIEGNEKKLMMGLALAQGAWVIISGIGFVVLNGFKLNVGEWFALVIGSYILGVSFDVAISSFMLYYYKLDLDVLQRRICGYLKIICFILAFVGLWIFTEGIANHIEYPLVSGFEFGEDVLRGGENPGGFGVKFYGICIVSGALICYAITDHMTYQKFHKHGLVDTLFIVSFLSGVLFARIWYCVILCPGEFTFIEIFTTIRDGGLAIQGGAMGGILAGVTFMLVFRKYIDVRFMMDVAVPTILLAQVLGRWGNFFNQEVYGKVCTKESLWFVPTIIKNNMYIFGEKDHVWAYRVPLFFIEGTINLGGYFFIRYFLGKVCKFHVGLGYQASFYLVWYGLVRTILEPLREGFTWGGHDGGFGYLQSFFVAIGMIALGLLLFLGFFLIHKIRKDKGLEDEFGEKIKGEVTNEAN